MTSNYMSPSTFLNPQSYRTPPTAAPQQPSTPASSTPPLTPDMGSSARHAPSSDPIFAFSPSLAQEIAAGQQAMHAHLTSARARTASQRLQDMMAQPTSPTLRPGRQIPLMAPAPIVAFSTPAPLHSPVAPQAPSSDLIFEFSPSLAREIATRQAQPSTARPSVAQLAVRAMVSSQRLQRMMDNTPGGALPVPARSPVRNLASAFSFGSDSAQTTSSMNSIQVSLRSGDTDNLRRSRSPSPEGFAMTRWLSNETQAPQRRPSTPMPPTETTRDADGSDSDSDSDVTQGPCAPATKRQRRG